MKDGIYHIGKKEEKTKTHFIIEAERDLVDRKEKIIRTKELLLSEETIMDLGKNEDTRHIEMLPILHNEGEIILQFHGWSINLLENGRWIWEATDGG